MFYQPSARLRSFGTARDAHCRALDEHVTVPVWGFRDLDHYLTESSCSEYLDQVKVPLLGINALVSPLKPGF